MKKCLPKAAPCLEGLLLLFFEVFFLAAGAEFHPLGPERRINTYTGYNQYLPKAACDYAGNFIVIWTNGEVWARRFDRDGTPLEDEFMVNTLTEYLQADVTVAMSWTGSFVIAWSDFFGYDGSAMGVYARLYDSSGQPAGPEFLVPSLIEGSQFEPFASMDPEGNFVITWCDSQLADAFGRRFDSEANPLGDQFLVNSYTSGWQLYPHVAMHPGGDCFVSAFVDASGLDGDDRGIFARLFDEQGLPAGEQFQVNHLHTYGRQASARVAMDGRGRFIVAWEDRSGGDGDGIGVFARRFDPEGNPLGDEFQVNGIGLGDQVQPEVAADFAGNFIITWADASGESGGIRARRFDAEGVPLEGEFLINTAPPGGQWHPTAAMDLAGEEIVFAFDGPGDGQDIYCRQYRFHPISIVSPPWAGALLARSPSPPLLPCRILPPAGGSGESRIGLEIHFPGSGGLPYRLFLSSGTSPGQPLPDGRTFFLNDDSTFRFFLLLEDGGFLENFSGTLDGNGRARASIRIPSDPALCQWEAYIGGLSWEKGVPKEEGLRTATDPVHIVIQ